MYLSAIDLVNDFIEEYEESGMGDSFSPEIADDLAERINDFIKQKTDEMEGDITEFDDEEILSEVQNRLIDDDFKAALMDSMDAPEILLDEHPPLSRQLRSLEKEHRNQK